MITLQKFFSSRGVIVEFYAEESKITSRKNRRGFEIAAIVPDTQALNFVDSKVHQGHTAGTVVVMISWKPVNSPTVVDGENELAEVPWAVAAA